MKRITYHLVAAILYVIAVLFVLGGETVDIYGRMLIVVFFVFSQVFAAIAYDANNN